MARSIFRTKYLSLWLAVFSLLPTAQPLFAVDIFEQEITNLMQVEMTSAGRKKQNLADVSAAAYIIDQKTIQESGATSVPELLRFVPGIQVARINAHRWAISSRGFNGTFSNKLLVQIDGRSVYSPTYSGVYWDVQTLVLEDIERIEVIRGPGATLWGANAVNGIINIITKQASDSLGGLLSASGGNQERGSGTFRYGTQLNHDLYGRLHVSHQAQDSYRLFEDQSDAYDDWSINYGGFRLDGDFDLDDSWTLQGDIYRGRNHQYFEKYLLPASLTPERVRDTVDTYGGNLLGRWEHQFNSANSWELRSYLDHTHREEIYITQQHTTFDVDFQHRFRCLDRHDLVWGLGFRGIQDEFKNSYQYRILPESRTTRLWSTFVQDDISLQPDRLNLIVGIKAEHNDYTGSEFQPNLRLLWKPGEKHSLWTAVSRAVRTPSRSETEGQITSANLPVLPYRVTVDGNPDLKAEDLLAFEAGYRFYPSRVLAFDMAVFHNEYENLQSFVVTSDYSASFSNSVEGYSYGFELTGSWQATSWLNTELNYSFLNLHLQEKDPTAAASFSSIYISEDSAPQHQLSLRIGVKLNPRAELNLWGRYVDHIKANSAQAQAEGLSVDSYTAVDANLIWQVNRTLELRLAGQNLLDENHLEFIGTNTIAATEIGRSVYAKLNWAF